MDDIAGVHAALRRLRNECHIALESWALFEAGNGYPTAERGRGLHAKINSTHEGHGINQIQRMIGRDIVASLARMTDPPRERSNNRQSLGFIASQLRDQSDESIILRAQNDFWVSRADAEQLLGFAKVRLLAVHSRSLQSVRESVIDMRNRQIAHALNGENTRLPRFFEIRDGLVFCIVASKKMSLLLAGVNWDPRTQWRTSLSEARAFWRRYESGFD